MEKNTNFLLYGEGTFLNKGCEAIVGTTAKKIKETCNGTVILATNDYNYDKKYFNEYIDKYIKQRTLEEDLTQKEKELLEYYKTIEFNYENFENIYYKKCIKEIDNADICISIGGDNYCYGEPNWLYTINKAIRAKNKINIFWCTSIFEKIESPEMIRDLRTFDMVLARESLTYKALLEIMDKDRVMLTPDTAFSLKPTKVELPAVFNNYKKVVTINISPLIAEYIQDKNILLDSVKELIKYILKNDDYAVCLLPHVYTNGNNDLDSLEKIKTYFKNNDRVEVLNDRIYSSSELKYIISKSYLLVAARTHASIAGYSSTVPTLVIGYSVKSKGIALDIFGNYEDYVIPVDSITPDLLLQKYQYIEDNYSSIKNILEEKMPDYKESADNQLKEVLEKIEELYNKKITHESQCTGCMTCMNVCPVSAIKKVKSKLGFVYTEIDESKCIKCNKCRLSCPANKQYDSKSKKLECYAAKIKNESYRKNSSSGGLFSALAITTLNKNGVVYGASYEDNNTIEHIRIDKIENLSKIMGSKYVQSNIEKIYKQLKEDLEQGIEVLFSGTPCQIEGIKSYLDKDYDNLICVGIICHGVPSNELFKKYIKEVEEKKNKQISKVFFRDKTNGWHNFTIKYEFEDGTHFSKSFTEDTYMKGFLKNFYLRESCYNCQSVVGKKNSSDIIIGDYWGIEIIMPDIDDDKGITAIIVNSNKGKKVLESIKDQVDLYETNYNDILKYNPVLEGSVKYNKYRNVFIKNIDKKTIIMNIEETDEIMEREELKNKVQKLSAENEELKNYIHDLLEAKEYFLKEIDNKNKELSQKAKELVQKTDELDDKQKEIQKMINSRRWRYTEKISRIIHLSRKK